MLLIFGQFWNQTRLSWDWQRIGGTPTSDSDAHQFAYGFALSYGVACKVIERERTTMYLPEVADEGQANTWPALPAGQFIQTRAPMVQ
jgi:hypothetical protein